MEFNRRSNNFVCHYLIPRLTGHESRRSQRLRQRERCKKLPLYMTTASAFCPAQQRPNDALVNAARRPRAADDNDNRLPHCEITP